MTEIPSSLTEKLRAFEPLYIRLAVKSKTPIEKHWREDVKKIDNPELQDYLKRNGNYGVATGYGLVVVDLDPDGIDSLSGKFPLTFSVRTGRSGLHLYYLCNLEKKIVLENNGTHFGEVQTNGEYVVGPGSTHPNGKKYEIQHDIPLTQISKEDLFKILKGYTVSDSVFKKIEDQTDRERRDYPIDIEMSQLVDLSKFSFNGKEYWGSNPFHGSATGSNTWINQDKNCWICFRHHSGGGPFHWLAIDAKIISCGEDLTHEKWVLTVEEAKKRGLITETKYTEILEKTSLKYADTRVGLIEHLEKNYQFYCREDDPNLNIYVWRGDCWKKQSEAIILKELSEISKKDRPIMSYEELEKYFKGRGQKTKIENKPPTLIVFKNGFYNLENNSLEPHNPKCFYVNVLKENYVEGVPNCLNWIRFIHEVHKPEDVDFIQEWWGYNLYTSYAKKALTIFIGVKNNGKTIEMQVAYNVLGEENCTPITLQELTYEEFALAELENKLANICDELPSNEIKNVEKVDNASSGGILSAQRKGSQLFQFRNYAKITYATNEPPEIKADLEAFWERLRIIEFPYVFTDHPDLAKGEKQAIERDELVTLLLSEREGILNWMLEGLKRLYKNKWKFSYSKSVEEGKQYYKIKANPVLCWIDEANTGNEDDYLAPDKAYEDYSSWLEAKKINNIISKPTFFRRMSEAGYKAGQIRGLDMKRFYIGFCNAITRNITNPVQDLLFKGGEREGENIGVDKNISRYRVTLSNLCEDCYNENKEAGGLAIIDYSSSDARCESCGEKQARYHVRMNMNGDRE